MNRVYTSYRMQKHCVNIFVSKNKSSENKTSKGSLFVPILDLPFCSTKNIRGVAEEQRMAVSCK